MRKYLSIIVCLVAMTALFSCTEKLNTTKVIVECLTDTAFTARIDGREITFDITQARYDNGMVMSGDSACVHYVGELRDGKVKVALVRLIPKKGNVVDAVYDPSKELKTKPMTEDEAKRVEEDFEEVRRLQNQRK